MRQLGVFGECHTEIIARVGVSVARAGRVCSACVEEVAHVLELLSLIFFFSFFSLG